MHPEPPEKLGKKTISSFLHPCFVMFPDIPTTIFQSSCFKSPNPSATRIPLAHKIACQIVESKD